MLPSLPTLARPTVEAEAGAGGAGAPNTSRAGVGGARRGMPPGDARAPPIVPAGGRLGPDADQAVDQLLAAGGRRGRYPGDRDAQLLELPAAGRAGVVVVGRRFREPAAIPAPLHDGRR